MFEWRVKVAMRLELAGTGRSQGRGTQLSRGLGRAGLGGWWHLSLGVKETLSFPRDQAGIWSPTSCLSLLPPGHTACSPTG